MDRKAWRALVHGVTTVGHDLVTKPPPPCRPEQKYLSHSYTSSHLLLPSVFFSIRVFSNELVFISGDQSIGVSALASLHLYYISNFSLASWKFPYTRLASIFELFVGSDCTVPWSILFWLNMLRTLLKTKTCFYNRHINELEVVFCFVWNPHKLKN